MSEGVDFLETHLNGIKLFESFLKLISSKKPSQEELKNFFNILEILLVKMMENNKNLNIILQVKSLIERVIQSHKTNDYDSSTVQTFAEENMATSKNSSVINRDKKNYFDDMNIQTEVHAKGLNDIAGYDNIKKVLKMSLIWPLRHQRLFANQKKARTILLYGPPGTGKTHFVHGLAAEANAKLYSVLSSNILSSYVGQTEKTINTIFSKLREATETTILFIDEVDGLCMKRREAEFDHTRRLKTELMCHLTNFDKNPNTYFIGATNRPWDIDSAFLRRFKKVLYVPLPNHTDRFEIMKLLTRDTSLYLTHPFWNDLLDKTEGFSCSDLEALIDNASNKPLSEFCDAKIWKVQNKKYVPWNQNSDNIKDTKLSTFDDLPADFDYELRQPELKDIIESLSEIKSTVSPKEILKFEEYSKVEF